MRVCLLFAIFCPATLLTNDLAASAHLASTTTVADSRLWAPQNAELTGQAGSVAREVNSSLDRFDKILAAPGSRLKSAWRAAKGYLESAESNHKKILSRYSSRFDPKNAAWVKLEARLLKAQAAGKAFEARVAAGAGTGPASGAKPAPKAAPGAKLTGSAGYVLKKVVQSLSNFDKKLARADDYKDKTALYRAAKRDLDEADEQHQKISRDFAGQFDLANAQWVSVTARLAKANTDLQAFYHAKVEGGGTNADGSKVTGYSDAQSIVPASSPNRGAVDSTVQYVLIETELIRGYYESKGKQANLMFTVSKCLKNAKSIMSGLQSSFGSIINKESAEYLAIVSEVAQAERRAGKIPALVAADVKARDMREADQKRRAQLARAQSKAEQAAAEKARLKAYIDSVRFPSFSYQNAKLNKVATAVILDFYKGQKIERLQVREPYEVLREARLKKKVVTFGTYRYLRLAMILRSADGKAQVYKNVSMRNTQQPNGTWGPLQMFGGQYYATEIRSENINK